MLPPPTPTLDQLAQDWIALWQSELQALMADPALAERMARLLAPAARDAAHTTAPGATAAGLPPGSERDARGGREPGAADGGQREAALLDRIAALEQRLAALEARPAGSVPDSPKPARKRRDA